MISRNISLKPYNTFGLDYKADCLASLSSEEDAVSFFMNRLSREEPILILGEGSNILFTHDFNGTILLARIEGIKIEEKDNESIIVSTGAGVKWDNFVEWCMNKGFGGIENLSLIPGLVGAAAVQNIGAYGVEAKDVIDRVRTVDTTNGSVQIFRNKDCGFGYRNSVFKSSEKGHFLVTRVWFKLKTDPSFSLEYGSLNEEVSRLGNANLKNIRQAVINTRRSKLPDPQKIGNAGSFFKNPVINRSEFDRLRSRYPQIPYFDDHSGGIKLAAGWLIEQCGWKGRRIGDAGVYDKQALVLVNYGKATGIEILELSERIKESVFKEFGITLEREVEVIAAI